MYIDIVDKLIFSDLDSLRPSSFLDLVIYIHDGIMLCSHSIKM